MKKFLIALLLVLGLAAPCLAATNMLPGAVLSISNCTTATPIVCTTASNTLGVNDWVFITSVQGMGEANGIWQCSAVDATHCTLSGSVGVSTYTSGGLLTPLGVRVTGASKWFPVGQCYKTSVYVWSPGGGTATVNIEATSQIRAAVVGNSPIPQTPASILTTITNPDNGATGNGYFSPSVVVGFLRVNPTAVNAETVYGVITGWTVNGGPCELVGQ